MVLKKFKDGKEEIKVLDENDTNQFKFEEYVKNKTSNGNILIHLVCESGVYKFINNCFNELNNVQILDLFDLENDEKIEMTPLKLAKKNRLDNKYHVFFYLNELDEQNNSLFHKLVIENRMIALRLILEYASDNAFIDTIGFGLKNNENKTCFELAVELKNSEAIYLLNHYALIDKSLNLDKYPSIIEPSFSDIKEKIKYFMNFEKESIYDPNIITNLIFQGGGIKGIAYVDALQESRKNGIIDLNNIKRVGGTSAGAITAVLLGVGYNLVEIEEILVTFDFFKTLLDSDTEKTRKKFLEFLAAVKNYKANPGKVINQIFYYALKCHNKDPNDFKIGFFPGQVFLKWIEDKIFAKLKIKNATFKDLQSLIQNQPNQEEKNLKLIFLTGSNLTNGKIEIFSHMHSPDLIISDAVRISMSIPFIFHPYQYYVKSENTENGKIVDPSRMFKMCKGKKKGKGVQKDVLYVDGGLLYNYPINMFDTKRINDNIEYNYINNQTLGFRLVSEELKLDYESDLVDEFDGIEKNIKKSNEKLFDLVGDLINFYFESEERLHSERIKDQERTIYIDSKDVDGFNFKVSDEDKEKLRKSGKEAIRDFLNRMHNKKSKIINLFKIKSYKKYL